MYVQAHIHIHQQPHLDDDQAIETSNNNKDWSHCKGKCLQIFYIEGNIFRILNSLKKVRDEMERGENKSPFIQRCCRRYHKKPQRQTHLNGPLSLDAGTPTQDLIKYKQERKNILERKETLVTFSIMTGTKVSSSLVKKGPRRVNTQACGHVHIRLHTHAHSFPSQLVAQSVCPQETLSSFKTQDSLGEGAEYTVTPLPRKTQHHVWKTRILQGPIFESPSRQADCGAKNSSFPRNKSFPFSFPTMIWWEYSSVKP